MHEIGVVRQVLRTVENFAKENGLDRIDTIVLEIGDLSLVIPKYVEDIYNVIIKDTPFEFTKLDVYKRQELPTTQPLPTMALPRINAQCRTSASWSMIQGPPI